VIAIDGLQMFVDRLSRLEVGQSEVDYLKRAAQDLEAAVKSASLTFSVEHDTGSCGCENSASASISHHISEHTAVIGSTSSLAITREYGSATNPPDPILSAAARQMGPAIAGRIGEAFTQLVSRVQHD